jgi:hypothetical protein
MFQHYPCTYRELTALIEGLPEAQRRVLAEAKSQEALSRITDPAIINIVAAGWYIVNVQGNTAAEAAVKRKTASWQQGAPNPLRERERLGINRQLLDPKRHPPMEVLRDRMGTTGTVTVDLFLSALRIRHRRPTELELNRLDEALANTRMTLGRRTNGMAFTSLEVQEIEPFMEWFCDTVLACGVEGGVSSLFDTILLPDFRVLAGSLLAVVYPDGVPYTYHCMSKPGDCSWTDVRRYSVPRGRVTDLNRIPESSLRFIAAPIDAAKTRTVEQIRAIQSETIAAAKLTSTVDLGEYGYLTMRIPTISQAIEAKNNWVTTVESATAKLFSLTTVEGKRQRAISKAVATTRLRACEAWVESVSIYPGGESDEVETSTDRERIIELLDDLSGDAVLSDKIYAGMTKFISDASSFDLNVIPKIHCPSCNGEPAPEYGEHPMVTPIDIYRTFCHLVGQRAASRSQMTEVE